MSVNLNRDRKYRELGVGLGETEKEKAEDQGMLDQTEVIIRVLSLVLNAYPLEFSLRTRLYDMYSEL